MITLMIMPYCVVEIFLAVMDQAQHATTREDIPLFETGEISIPIATSWSSLPVVAVPREMWWPRPASSRAHRRMPSA